MEETSLISTIAIGLGVLFAVAAGVTHLLRQTQGVPPARRPRLMIYLVYSAVINALYRRSVAAVVAGFFAFVGTLCVGLAITLLVIWATSPVYSHETEAYETFGDLVSAMIMLMCGVFASAPMAGIVGFAVGERVAAGARVAVVPGQPAPPAVPANHATTGAEDES